jgi:outer membrane protein TolC
MLCTKQLLAVSALITAMLIIPAPAGAGDSLYTLDRCIQCALLNNGQTKIADAEIRLARSVRSEARSYFLPQLMFKNSAHLLDAERVTKSKFAPALKDALSESVAYFKLQEAIDAGQYTSLGIARGTDPDDVISNPAYVQLWQGYKAGAADAAPDIMETGLLGDRFYQAELDLQMPLFTWGKTAGKYAQAGLGISAAEAQKQKAASDVTYEVTKAYYGIVLAKEFQAIAEETRTRFVLLADLSERLYLNGSGEVNKLDYLKTKAGLTRAEVTFYEVRRSYESAQRALCFWMGVEDTDSVAIALDTLPYSTPEFNADSIISLACRRNPEYRKLTMAVKSARIDLAYARRSRLPDIALVGNYQAIVDNADFLNPPPEQWRIGVAASLPLFAGGRISAQAAKARAQAEKLQAQQATLRQAKEDARQRSELAQRGYKANLVETEDVFEAISDNSTIKETYCRTLYSCLVTKAKLNQLEGTGD